MRILVSGFTENYGGVEAFVMNSYRAMRQIDNHIVIDLVGYTAKPAYGEEIVEAGGHIYTLPSSKDLRHGRAVRKFFASHAGLHDAYWCNKCDLHDIGFLRAASHTIPQRILHAHNSRLIKLDSAAKNLVFGAMHRANKNRASRHATDLWTCSDWAGAWLFPPQEHGRVRFIPNAIDLEAFAFDEEVRQRYRDLLGLSGVVYGCVGRLSEEKNISFALRTFQHIWKRHPESHLLVVGAGKLEARLKQEAFELGCSDKVSFLGMRRDVPQLLQAMDCLLMPSLFEGFPVVSIEAQAAGIPVFAASEGITPQAQLTDLFHFLPLSAGPDGWSTQICAANLARRDRQDVLREKGFDSVGAARALLNSFTEALA